MIGAGDGPCSLIGLGRRTITYRPRCGVGGPVAPPRAAWTCFGEGLDGRPDHRHPILGKSVQLRVWPSIRLGPTQVTSSFCYSWLSVLMTRAPG